MIDDELVTPPTSEGVLPGLTRDTVLQCAKTAELAVAVKPMTRYELLAASEVFLAGSGAGLVAVASLDGTICGGASRPVLSRMQSAYTQFAADHGVPF